MDLSPRQRRQAAIAALLGNALEWYDFAVYGYVASALGEAFFPADVPALQRMASFGVFAVGYLMRPVGSLVLGPLGDLLGRRLMLSLSIVIMGLSSLLIGLLPATSLAAAGPARLCTGYAGLPSARGVRGAQAPGLPAGMVALPGGRFRMGSDRFYPEEQPLRDATVGPFAIQLHEVTNAQFGAFVKATGYRTVAEGVESRDQAEALANLGCDAAQGFLFSKPLPARQAERLLGALPAWAPISQAVDAGLRVQPRGLR